MVGVGGKWRQLYLNNNKKCEKNKFRCLCCINSSSNSELHYADSGYLSHKEQEFTSILLRILFITLSKRDVDLWHK